MGKELIIKYRSFLKDSIRKEIDFSKTDQSQGIAPLPIEKPYSKEGKRIDLPQFSAIGKIDLLSAIRSRKSHRSYSSEPMTLEELSFLLWTTQGIKEQLDAGHALRTVPSAGCRHALETYLCVLNIQGLDQGIYRYLPIEHQLLFEFSEENMNRKIVRAVFGQPYPGQAAVTFIWTATRQSPLPSSFIGSRKSLSTFKQRQELLVRNGICDLVNKPLRKTTDWTFQWFADNQL